MDSKNIIIGALSVTALVLLCTVLLLQSSYRLPGPSMAWADTVDRGGDYVLATGSFSKTNEALYVLDGAAERLNVYHYDKKRNRIITFDSANLQDYFATR